MSGSLEDRFPSALVERAKAMREAGQSWSAVVAELQPLWPRRLHRRSLSRAIESLGLTQKRCAPRWKAAILEEAVRLRQDGVPWAEVAQAMTKLTGHHCNEEHVRKSVRTAGQRRGIDVPQKPHHVWTAEQVARIFTLKAECKSWNEIAAVFRDEVPHITPAGVYSVFERHRLAQARAEPPRPPKVFAPPRLVYRSPFSEMLGEPPVGRSALDKKREVAA